MLVVSAISVIAVIVRKVGVKFFALFDLEMATACVNLFETITPVSFLFFYLRAVKTNESPELSLCLSRNLEIVRTLRGREMRKEYLSRVTALRMGHKLFMFIFIAPSFGDTETHFLSAQFTPYPRALFPFSLSNCLPGSGVARDSDCSIKIPAC